MIQPAPTFQTKEQYAYTSLRSSILRCELAPNEKIIIDRLSAEMGLSQIPIRAAIQRLQAEGLIIISPHASAIVAPLPPEKIDEVFALLENLECAAFRIAAQNHTDADLDILTDLVRQMDIAIAEPNSADWLTLNSSFHRKIAAISAMPLLIDFTNRTLDEWERISHFYFANITSARLPQAQSEHHQIIASLSARDIEALEALAVAHNREANRSYQSMLK